MQKQLEKRLKRTHDLLSDLLEFIPEEHLNSKLPSLPSNTIGQQYWCLIGARQSYLKAVKANEWSGFQCPLPWDSTSSRSQVKKYLNSTYELLQEELKQMEKFSTKQEDLFIDLLEHEVLHHGQLIRYLYGLKIGIPLSWQKRYSLKWKDE